MIRKSKVMEKLRKEQGITLAMLIISIVILIILVTVVIKSIMDMDIIGLATDSAVKYAKQQVEEEEMFNNLYSKILVADNDNAEITISVKDLETLINEKVKNATSDLNKKIELLETNNVSNLKLVDYSKLLYSTDGWVPDITYTATEDCWCMYWCQVKGKARS